MPDEDLDYLSESDDGKDTERTTMPAPKPYSSGQTTSTEERVRVTSLMRTPCPIIVLDENGKQFQQLLQRNETFGPVPRSRLTPQVEQLHKLKRVKIEAAR